MSEFQSYIEAVEQAYQDVESFLTDDSMCTLQRHSVKRFREDVAYYREQNTEDQHLHYVASMSHDIIEGLHQVATETYLRGETNTASAELDESCERIKKGMFAELQNPEYSAAYHKQVQAFVEYWATLEYVPLPFHNRDQDIPRVTNPRGRQVIDDEVAKYKERANAKAILIVKKFEALIDQRSTMSDVALQNEQTTRETSDDNPSLPTKAVMTSNAFKAEIDHGKALGLTDEEILGNIQQQLRDDCSDHS